MKSMKTLNLIKSSNFTSKRMRFFSEKVKFSYEDPLNFTSLLNEEEKMVRVFINKFRSCNQRGITVRIS
jgi:hypothetical protein